MNQAVNKIILPVLFLAIFLLWPFHAEASGWSCKSFWIDEMEKARQDKSYEPILMEKAEKLLVEQKKIFFEKYPDLYSERADKGYSKQSVFITLLNACPDGMNMTGPIEADIQKVLYQQFNYTKAYRQAAQEKCQITSGKAMQMFNMGEGVINLCSDEYSSAEIGINSNSSGQPQSIRFCPKPWRVNLQEWEGKSEKERCQAIMPSYELLCLSDHGKCQKREDGNCGWVHTEKSEQCLAKKN